MVSVVSAPPGTASSSHPETAFYAALLSMQHESNVEYKGEPVADVFLPVFSSFKPDRVPVAVMWVIIKWASYFDQLLPSNIRGVTVVLENSCKEAFTYEINGGDVIPIGSGVSSFDFERAALLSTSFLIAPLSKYNIINRIVTTPSLTVTRGLHRFKD
jgi:hypothetical protein